MEFRTDSFEEIPNEADAPGRMKARLVALKMMTDQPHLKQVKRFEVAVINVVKCILLAATRLSNGLLAICPSGLPDTASGALLWRPYLGALETGGLYLEESGQAARIRHHLERG